MGIQTPQTPQEYEVLTGGGAESAELARRGLSRRKLLRRGVGLTIGLVGVEAVYGALEMIYPNLAGQFGSPITLSAKSKYVPAEALDFTLDQKGVFYESNAKAYIMHLKTGPKTHFLLSGATAQEFEDSESWVKDSDGTYWLSLYQVCVHLGCKYPFRDDCKSFKCPCHGSHYNVDGEYLDGPAPRSADRFTTVFKGGNVVVDTGKLNQHVERPAAGTRILDVPRGSNGQPIVCSAQ